MNEWSLTVISCEGTANDNKSGEFDDHSRLLDDRSAV